MFRPLQTSRLSTISKSEQESADLQATSTPPDRPQLAYHQVLNRTRQQQVRGHGALNVFVMLFSYLLYFQSACKRNCNDDFLNDVIT